VEPSWAAPRPTIEEYILDIIEIFDGQFADPKFKLGVEMCFRSTGCIHNGSGNFVRFAYKISGGTFAIGPLCTVDAYFQKVDKDSALNTATDRVCELILDGEDDDDDCCNK